MYGHLKLHSGVTYETASSLVQSKGGKNLIWVNILMKMELFQTINKVSRHTLLKYGAKNMDIRDVKCSTFK